MNRSECGRSAVLAVARALYLPMALAVATLAPTPARADAVASPSAGRGFTWGGGAVAPIWLGALRYAEPPSAPVPYFALGGGVIGRIGGELAGGLALEVVVAIHGHSVDHMRENGGALVGYRAGVQARWMIETGIDLVPFVGAGGSILFLNRGGSLGTTGTVHGVLGAQWMLARWVALELAVEGDVVLPGAALAEVAGYLAPTLGADFYF